MNQIFKRIFWALPLSTELKQAIGRKRFEHILKKEEIADQKGKIGLVADQNVWQSYLKDLLLQPGSKSPIAKAYSPFPKSKGTFQLAAYYLTQFHPNPQNDAWWGKGTTEWNNVNQAIPQFLGHYQPRRPGELGYYDLRIKENMARQIELAKNYGIGAFCFYYYWFDGERLLERPLNMFLQNRDLDIPFFYCWANENWTKRFSGTDTGVLMAITETSENYARFIDSVLPDMQDDRYYCIDGKPVLSVYRPAFIPNAAEVLKAWREKARERIGKDLYLIAIQERDVGTDWKAVGFDAESEFQPKQIQHMCRDITQRMQRIRSDFSGQIYDYHDLVTEKRYIIHANQNKKVYPAVMPMWDNTARRNFRGIIFHGSTPQLYQSWLIDVLRTVKARDDLDAPLVFINAWNEWGEGAYLEPDEDIGYQYLKAISSCVTKEN